MPPELVSALARMGMTEHLIWCPSCDLNGIVMANSGDVSDRPCPRCGAELSFVSAPIPRLRAARVPDVLINLSLLTVLACFIALTLTDIGALPIAVAMLMAWLSLHGAWLMKRTGVGGKWGRSS